MEIAVQDIGAEMGLSVNQTPMLGTWTRGTYDPIGAELLVLLTHLVQSSNAVNCARRDREMQLGFQNER